jgi:hypothetical protein
MKDVRDRLVTYSAHRPAYSAHRLSIHRQLNTKWDTQMNSCAPGCDRRVAG